jgi:hypothetical protein
MERPDRPLRRRSNNNRKKRETDIMCSNQALHAHQTAQMTTGGTASRRARPVAALSPTFRILDERIETFPTTMKVLAAHREQIERAARSVGRIHQGGITLGTGFVIGPNVIMTARHVAQGFATDVDGTLKIRIGWTPAIDFLAEEPPPVPGPDTSEELAPDTDVSKALAAGRGNPSNALTAETMPAEHMRDYHVPPQDEDAAPSCYPIRSILYDNEDFDIALLLVPMVSVTLPTSAETSSGPDRTPLTIATTAPLAESRAVCVIGCPDRDPFATDAERHAIFKGVFDVKRVQPGEINRVLIDQAIVGHTCSTLRGNSGSPVIDLERNEVIGLHVRGSRERPGEQALNEATALWLLSAEVMKILKSTRDLFVWKNQMSSSEAKITHNSAMVEVAAKAAASAH